MVWNFVRIISGLLRWKYGKIICQQCQREAIKEFNGVHTEKKAYDTNELATNHHCSPTSSFSIGKVLKNEQNCAHCKIIDYLFLDNGLCLKQRQRVTPSTQEKEFCFNLYFLWSYSSNKVKPVDFNVIHSVMSFNTIKKCVGYWLASAKSFLTLY